MLKKNLFLLFVFVTFSTLNAWAVSKDADFIFANDGEPQSLDPQLVDGKTEHNVVSALFEGLVTLDPQTGHAQAGMAEKWEISPDLLTVTFHLRLNLKWSDGTAITAQTVYDSWMRELNPDTAAPQAFLLTNTILKAEEFTQGRAAKEDVGLKVLDSLTFQVRLKSPTSYFIDLITSDAFSLVPLQAIFKSGNSWTRPGNIVSNGPYLLKEWQPNQYILLSKNPNYWNANAVKLNSIKILPIDDLKTAYSMYKQGAVDWLSSVPLDLYDEIKQRSDLHVTTNWGSYYFIFNVQVQPFQDARVRKALAMAIDREALVTQVLNAGHKPAKSLVPPLDGYPLPAGLPYDVASAKKLLADAGYPDGKGFPKFTLMYNNSPGHEKIAQFIQQQFKKNLGIDTALQSLDWKSFLATKQKHQYQLARTGWNGDYFDPSNFLELFQTGTENNDGQYSNPKFDELLNKAANMPAGPERMAILSQAEDILLKEDAALIPLYFYVSTNLINLSKWGGWYNNPLNSHPWQYLYKK